MTLVNSHKQELGFLIFILSRLAESLAYDQSFLLAPSLFVCERINVLAVWASQVEVLLLEAKGIKTDTTTACFLSYRRGIVKSTWKGFEDSYWASTFRIPCTVTVSENTKLMWVPFPFLSYEIFHLNTREAMFNIHKVYRTVYPLCHLLVLMPPILKGFLIAINYVFLISVTVKLTKGFTPENYFKRVCE